MSFVIQQPMVVSTTTEIDIPPSADLIDCIGIEIINDTTFAYNIVLPGGKQSYMAPQTIKFFAGTDWYGAYTKIFPLSVMAGTWTGIPQKLIILGYRRGEQIPVDGSVQNISKTSVVGNAITVANMNILQNDGGGAGTTIIETTVAGQVSSNQTATNDGVWNLGIVIGGVITPFFVSKTIDPILQLGAVGKTVEVMGALQVDGAFSTANLSVTNLNVAGTQSTTGSATFSNVTASGNANVGGTFSTTGNTTLNSNLVVSGTAGVSGVTTLASNANVGGTFSTTGAAIHNSTLNVSGLTTLSNTNVSGTLSATGIVTVASNANVGGTFSTTGNATLNSNLVVSGTAGISGVVTAASNMNVGGTFSTTGAVSLPSTATIGSTSVTGNAKVNGTSVVAGAGTAFSVTNSATIGQDLNVFGNLTLTNGPGTNNRLFANIQIGDNNSHIYTNSDNGTLVFTKSNGSSVIASINDTTGLTVSGSTVLNGAVSNKISSNNIVQGSIFNGSSSSTTANQTFNHNFNSANGNPLAVFLIDITGTQPAQQFVIVSITSTQVTFKSNGTGSFTGFAVRA